MARIFTVDFEFRGGQHTAIVSTWKGEKQSDCFQVSLYDEALHHFLPEGIVRFSTADRGTKGNELAQCLEKAVVGYLQKAPV